MSIQEILESAGLPAQRGVYTGRDKARRILYVSAAAGYACGKMQTTKRKSAGKCIELRFYIKGDFEAQLDKTKEVLKAAGVYINSIDAESYETETGYWLVPITVEILKEE